MDKFLVINGPNLNLLGSREPDIYGKYSLSEIEDLTNKRLENAGHKVDVEWFQSNGEKEIIEKIQAASNASYRAVIINPAAFSHTSIAILDALRVLSCPVVEVHLSNAAFGTGFPPSRCGNHLCFSHFSGLQNSGVAEFFTLSQVAATDDIEAFQQMFCQV